MDLCKRLAVALCFGLGVFSSTTHAAYVVSTLGSGYIDKNRPVRLIFTGAPDKLGNQFYEAALARARVYREVTPGDQVVIWQARERPDRREAELATALGATVINDNEAHMNGVQLMRWMKQFRKIASIEIYSHSSWATGAAMQTGNGEDRLTPETPELSSIRGNFVEGAFAVLYGCNSGFLLAPALSNAWGIPVAGSFGATDFQNLHKDGNFYLQGEGNFPEDPVKWTKWPFAAANRVSFSEPVSCQSAGCIRMMPENNPYKGVWGNYRADPEARIEGGGLGFYKFFCNYDWGPAGMVGDRLSRGEKSCLRGMGNFMMTYLTTIQVVDVSFEAYKTRVLEFMCPRVWWSKKREECVQQLQSAESFPMLSYSSFRGNPLECDYKTCRFEFTYDRDHNRVVIRDSIRLAAPKVNNPRTQVKEYLAYLKAFSLVNGTFRPIHAPRFEPPPVPDVEPLPPVVPSPSEPAPAPNPPADEPVTPNPFLRPMGPPPPLPTPPPRPPVRPPVAPPVAPSAPRPSVPPAPIPPTVPTPVSPPFNPNPSNPPSRPRPAPVTPAPPPVFNPRPVPVPPRPFNPSPLDPEPAAPNNPPPSAPTSPPPAPPVPPVDPDEAPPFPWFRSARTESDLPVAVDADTDPTFKKLAKAGRLKYVPRPNFDLSGDAGGRSPAQAFPWLPRREESPAPSDAEIAGRIDRRSEDLSSGVKGDQLARPRELASAPVDACRLDRSWRSADFFSSITQAVEAHLPARKIYSNEYIDRGYGLPGRARSRPVGLSSNPICMQDPSSIAAILGPDYIPDPDTIAALNDYASTLNALRLRARTDRQAARKLSRAWSVLFGCIAYAESLSSPGDLDFKTAEGKVVSQKSDFDGLYREYLERNEAARSEFEAAGMAERPSGVILYQDRDGGYAIEIGQARAEGTLTPEKIAQLKEKYPGWNAFGLYQFRPEVQQTNITTCVQQWNEERSACAIPFRDSMFALALASPGQTFNAYCGVMKVVEAFNSQVNTVNLTGVHPQNHLPGGRIVAPEKRCVSLLARGGTGRIYAHFGPLRNSTRKNLAGLVSCVKESFHEKLR